MALADYFDKAALAASHVLESFDVDAFREILERHTIGVGFDESSLTPEGEVTLELAVNLLARLFPRLALSSTASSDSPLVSQLQMLAERINPKIEVSYELKSATASLVLGAAKPELEGPVLFVGSDGWVAKYSRNFPVSSGATANPFGAAAAACLGVANIFRYVFMNQLKNGDLDEDIHLSLLNYGQSSEASNLPLSSSVDLADTHLVGVGAIGNAALWTLARVPGLCGTIHLVDSEQVELSNLQRYVLTTRESVGASKVDLAKGAFPTTSVILRAHNATWGSYLAGRSNFYFECVATALDTARGRIDVQASLPKRLLNAWTQRGNLGVSRHAFAEGDDDACLSCLYLPEQSTKSESERIAEEIGLPDAEREVRTLLVRRTPMTREFLERIAAAKGVDVGELVRFEGQDLYAFHSRAVCGGMLLRLGADSPAQGSIEAPMAFQSALAGVMLAAEMVIHMTGIEGVSKTRTELDLLNPVGKHLSQIDKKHSSGNCICQDPDYQAAYRKKYAVGRE